MSEVAAEAAQDKLIGELRITGSSTMAPLVRAIGDRFQALHPGVKVRVESGGSAKGLKDVREGRADIGMFGRAMTEEEKDLLGFPIARDGVCLVVHKDNPVIALSYDQIVGIYRGRIATWSEAGGREAAIVVISRSEGRSQFELFTTYFKLQAAEIKAKVTLGDNALVIKAVEDDPDAIAYISIGEAEQREKEGVGIKLLPMGDIAASSENVRNGGFPISRPLTLVTAEHPSGLVKDFIKFSLSSQVTEIIREQHFVPYLD